MEFAKALGLSGKRHDGYMEDGDNIITWCVGHLVTLSYPEKYDPELAQWSLDTLPFLPKNYLYEVIPESSKQYRVVASLLNRRDVGKIYYSGDSGREGEYIQRLVRQQQAGTSLQRNTGSGLIPRRTRKSSGASGRRSRFLSMIPCRSLRMPGRLKITALGLTIPGQSL